MFYVKASTMSSAIRRVRAFIESQESVPAQGSISDLYVEIISQTEFLDSTSAVDIARDGVYYHEEGASDLGDYPGSREFTSQLDYRHH